MSQTRKAPAGRVLSVFLEHQAGLKRFLRRIAPASLDVEDISQETILRALQAEREREILEPRAYLFVIARNIVRDALDKKTRSVIDFIEDFSPETLFSNEPPVEEQVESRQRLLLFLEAVATLPEQCQQVFVLKKVYGYSHREISRKLRISVSTTEKHVATGLKRCSEFIERHEASQGSQAVRRRSGEVS